MLFNVRIIADLALERQEIDVSFIANLAFECQDEDLFLCVFIATLAVSLCDFFELCLHSASCESCFLNVRNSYVMLEMGKKPTTCGGPFAVDHFRWTIND